MLRYMQYVHNNNKIYGDLEFDFCYNDATIFASRIQVCRQSKIKIIRKNVNDN